MSRSPIPRHRALLAGFCLAGALSAQAATQEEILDAALVSGDSSQLTDSHLVALRLQQQVERIRQTRTQLLDGLYQNLSQAYDPGAASIGSCRQTRTIPCPSSLATRGACSPA